MIRVSQWPMLAAPGVGAMIPLFVLLLITTMGITPAPMHGYFVTAGTATFVDRGAVQIDVDSKGRYYIDDRPVTDAGLQETLRIALRANPSGAGVVHLVADGNAPYDRVEQALAVAGALGVRRAELIADCPHDRETFMRQCAPQHP